MTVAAAIAAVPSGEGDAFVGCVADSRLFYDKDHVDDGFDKLFPLFHNACAVGAGLQEPFLAIHLEAKHDIKRLKKHRKKSSGRDVGLWEIAGIYLGLLREAAAKCGTEDPVHALIAGFSVTVLLR